MCKRKALIIILSIFSLIYSRPYYLSPGLSIRWDFRSHFVASPKISLGTYGNSDLNMLFSNITVGVKQPMGKAKDSVLPCIYIEFQSGWISELEWGTDDYDSGMFDGSDPVIFGGGLGLALHRGKDKFYIGPKFSAFAGFIGFAVMDADYTKELGWNGDFGAQLVLPLIWFELPPD